MIETYEDLSLALSKLTKDQMRQHIQIAEIGSVNSPVVLQPVFCIGTVHELYETDGEGNLIGGEPTKVVSSWKDANGPDTVILLGDMTGLESDTELRKGRIATKALAKISEHCSGKFLAVATIKQISCDAMENIKKLDEKSKSDGKIKILKK